MNQTISLNPVQATDEVMTMLEQKDLIFRIKPRHNGLNPGQEDIAFTPVYVSDEAFGPHRLLAVTINRSTFPDFGWHSENEEFIIVGESDTKPLYLLTATVKKDELQRKIDEGSVSEEDFLLLDLTYNDANTSIFTMKKDVPHTEATKPGAGKPPSFYVTESDKIDLIKVDLKGYELVQE